MNLPALQDLLREGRPRLPALSRKTGLSPERLAALAEGAEPSLKEWRILAKHFRLRSRASSQDPIPDRYSFLFRSPFGGKQVTRSLLMQLSSKMMISDELKPGNSAARILSYQPNFVSHANYLDAEANARIFRQLFVDGDQHRPLLDLPFLASRNLGIRVFLIDTPGVEGASVVSSDDAFIFVARRFAPRMLFTLAHEIAHVFFHQEPGGEFVNVDLARAELAPRHASRNELYAHAFASALLMPDVGVGNFLRRFRERSGAKGPLGDIEISVLARFFGVSFLAAAVRCESLKLLPPGGAASLDEKIRKEFGSAEKRASELGLPDREPIDFPYFPEDLLTAALDRIREGSMSIGRASAELGITVEELISANEQIVH